MILSRGLLGVAARGTNMDGDEQLIECVRELPCDWKTRLKSYKDQTAKENAWKEVAKQVIAGISLNVTVRLLYYDVVMH